MTRKNKTQTKRFMITKIDPDLWRKFKSACASYDLSIRECFIYFMVYITDFFEMRSSDDLPAILKRSKELKKKC